MVEPLGGVTETTVGGLKGEVAPGVRLSASPHHATTVANRNAGIQDFMKFELRISFSSSHTCQAIHSVEPRYREYEDLEISRLCKFEQHAQKTVELSKCPL